MYHRALSLAAIGAALALSAGGAAAADLDSIIYAPEVDRTVPVEIGNGWYLRGDIGYSLQTEGDIDTLTFGGVTTDASGFDLVRFDSEFSGDLGVGHQFTDFLRTDLTAGYSRGEAQLTTPGVATNADFDAVTVLANAYVDLGTFVGITPYIGAGVGSTYLKWSDDLSLDTIPPSGAPLVTEGDGSWRFTYALMAGASYDISKSLKFDLGYRYLDVAGGPVFDDPSGDSADDDGYSKHEVRAGLRYMLW